jgi:hypothetical protein
MSSDDLLQWLKEKGYEPEPISSEKSIYGQKIHSFIFREKSYRVLLDVYYTSNVFGTNKVCRISKRHKLISCSNSQAIDSRDEFYWKLVE